MKILFLIPPLSEYSQAIHRLPATLAGELAQDNNEVLTIDLNCLFDNFIISQDFLSYFDFKFAFYKSELEFLKNSHPDDEKNILYLEKLLEKEIVFKNKYLRFLEKYPNPKMYISNILKKTFLAQKRFYESMLELISNFKNLFFLGSSKNPEKYNFFYDWIKDSVLPKISDFYPDFICFTIESTCNNKWNSVESSYFLSGLIKKQLDTKIIILGSYITNHQKYFVKNSRFDCIDYYIYGECDIALKKITDNEDISSIPNIIYNTKDGCKINEFKKVTRFMYKLPNYNGINFNDYLLPSPVVELEASIGCYWAKCEYCSFCYGLTFKQRNIDDVINEIKTHVFKGIKHFVFTDLEIHPNYARELANKIIENKLNIYYYALFRFEKEFIHKDIWKLLFKSGLRIAQFGLESGSDRILKIMNKGTDSATNALILRAIPRPQIKTYVTTINTFPSNTKEDLDLTREFLRDNYNYIDKVFSSNLVMYDYSPMAKHPENFNLTKKDFEKQGSLYIMPNEINSYSIKTDEFTENLYKEKYDFQPASRTYSLVYFANKYP